MNMNNLRFILAILLITVLFFVLAVGVAAFVVPKTDGGHSLVVMTGSMRPYLNEGDIIINKAPTPDNVRVGGIVSYFPEANNPDLITHRVTGKGGTIKDNWINTKGDNNDKADDPIKFEQIHGVYWYHIPKIGYIFNYVGGLGSNATKIAATIIVLVSAVIFIWPSGSSSSRKEEEDENEDTDKNKKDDRRKKDKKTGKKVKS